MARHGFDFDTPAVDRTGESLAAVRTADAARWTLMVVEKAEVGSEVGK